MPEPVDGPSAIAWAAFWTPKVAKELGFVHAWLKGDSEAIREIALALPILVGMWEREREIEKWTARLVSPLPLKDFLEMNNVSPNGGQR